LEDLQDAFDFCFKVHYQPGEDRNRDPQYARQLQVLQAKLQHLDQQRREMLAQMQQLLGRSETLRELLQEELGDWKERQQRSCLGAPTNTHLRQLETWFTELGQGLFQLRQLLRALSDLQKKVTYERDPLVADIPLLEQRLQEQLVHLLKRAGLCPPRGSRPPTRSLFLPRRFRRFNILPSTSKTLLAGDSPQEGLVCDFQYLVGASLRPPAHGDCSATSSQGPLAVTEELHIITFTLAYAYCGLELELETSTLPFVIISNNNQFSSAWASILWFNMLSSDPKAQHFFSAPPRAPWPRLAEVLSWQFESVAERGLSGHHLLMMAEKLFGKA
ncbi:STAT2 protein, partial [Smithornis capensis]|nr:STAT2 protein [Smithornis capensis]